MKLIAIILLLISPCNLFAQTTPVINNRPHFDIHVTTVSGNSLIGLFMKVCDSSVLIYPGNRKEWENKIHYKHVSYDYTRIKSIRVKRKNRVLNGMLIGGGIGATVFAGSTLFFDAGSKSKGVTVSLSAVPLGIIAGGIIGRKSRKKYSINGQALQFNKFKKTQL